jgi:hypothetical protein
LVIAACAIQAAASQISRSGRAIASGVIRIDDRRSVLSGIDLVMRERTCLVAAGFVVDRP